MPVAYLERKGVVRRGSRVKLESLQLEVVHSKGDARRGDLKEGKSRELVSGSSEWKVL